MYQYCPKPICQSVQIPGSASGQYVQNFEKSDMHASILIYTYWAYRIQNWLNIYIVLSNMHMISSPVYRVEVYIELQTEKFVTKHV